MLSVQCSSYVVSHYSPLNIVSLLRFTLFFFWVEGLIESLSSMEFANVLELQAELPQDRKIMIACPILSVHSVLYVLLGRPTNDLQYF